MEDLVFVMAVILFFAVAVLFVKGCDRIIGSDEAALAEEPADDPALDVGTLTNRAA